MPLAACQVTLGGSDPETPEPGGQPAPAATEPGPARAANPQSNVKLNPKLRNAQRATSSMGRRPADPGGEAPTGPTTENPAGCCVGTAFYSCSEQSTLDSCNQTASCVQECGTSDAACAAACLQTADPATAGCVAVPERDSECSGA